MYYLSNKTYYGRLFVISKVLAVRYDLFITTAPVKQTFSDVQDNKGLHSTEANKAPEAPSSITDHMLKNSSNEAFTQGQLIEVFPLHDSNVTLSSTGLKHGQCCKCC